MNNFKSLHKEIVDNLISENLRHEYFKIFYEMIIADTFDT